MSDIMKKLKGLELPDELLEAVSGGVLTAGDMELLEYLRASIAGMSEEDREELRLEYTKIWDATSDEDKAEVYKDEFLICELELFMGRSLR